VRRAAATTWNPSAASRRAVAAPIPLDAPVTTAIGRSGTLAVSRPPADAVALLALGDGRSFAGSLIVLTPR
jgi:hypothetical protein